MSLVVNNNMMAANTARNLNAHYGRLATSTQRLSSGLRINSAADDAAGLAIRELQRADIAALQQGARNANDAISMIQVADGSLGIIDEKLIRMKELAEQAATGTYDSTQRLMIESEYQAMASEITRIANATDFNGTKLLDGTLAGEHDGSGLVSEGKMKIHFGTGNDSAEDYYYVEIGECTSEAFGLGNNSTWQDVQRRGINAFADSLKQSIKNSGLSAAEQGTLLEQIGKLEDDGTYSGALGALNEALKNATDYTKAFEYFAEEDLEKYWPGNSMLMQEYMAAASGAASKVVEADVTTAVTNALPNTITPDPAWGGNNPTTDELNAFYDQIIGLAEEAAKKAGLTTVDFKTPTNTVLTTAQGDLNNTTVAGFLTNMTTAITGAIAQQVTNQNDQAQNAQAANIEKFWGSLRETEKQKLQYAWGQAAIDKIANGEDISKFSADPANPDLAFTFGDDLQDAASLAKAKEMLTQALKDVKTKVGHMDFAGHTIETQEDAQMALDAINEAIVSKDKIRAHLGATQNRLENTVSNLNIQAENLQAAESRISDVDVATEMTQFVRNQILTQSAVAMLSQANSLPQMAMQLIGG